MVNKVLDFLKVLKKENNIITFLGGYHPSGNPSIVNNKYVDYIVVGEGKIPSIKLIKNILNNKLPKYPVIKSEEQINMEDYNWPIRNPKYLRQSKAYPFFYPIPSEQISTAMITFGRGCYYNCSFCASQLMARNKDPI
jgi:radical SAM superfamily enzyme YgiQ (UPF0313 family)